MSATSDDIAAAAVGFAEGACLGRQSAGTWSSGLKIDEDQTT